MYVVVKVRYFGRFASVAYWGGRHGAMHYLFFCISKL